MANLSDHRSQSNPNQPPRGGQYHIGLFGTPSITGRPRRFPQTRVNRPAPAALTPRTQAVRASLLSDAQEIEREEAAARAATTSAMHAAAVAADMREAFPHLIDDEEADYLRRCAGAGYVEITLAMEGN